MDLLEFHLGVELFFQKPSIASGNQVCNPICADFSTTPMKSKIQIIVLAVKINTNKSGNNLFME
jgi:hypothetical protein